MIEVAQYLSGGTGTGGADLVSLHYWLIRFGEESGDMRQIVAEFSDWLVNERHPWSAYHVLMLGRLIGLNNPPGVWPVGLGVNCQQLMAKCVLEVVGQ